MLRHSRIKAVIDLISALSLALMLTVGTSFLPVQSLQAQTGSEETTADETAQEEGEEDSDSSGDEAFDDSEEEGDEATTTDRETSDDKSAAENQQDLKRILDVRRNMSFVELTQDTDSDGVIDYDEENIYNTDPEQTDSSNNDMTDAEMIKRGLDPRQENNNIDFADPRNKSSDTIFTDDYQLTEVLLESDTSSTVFRGVAQSNQFVTLFLYPDFDPVTVQADELGEWEYQYDEVLTDGSYELYMATADGQGRLLGRSAPVEFSVEADEVSVSQSRSADIKPQPVNTIDFLWDNFLLVGILLALIVIILVVVVSGLKRTIKN